MGGTEISLLNLAKLLSKKYNVFIFSNITENEVKEVDNIYDQLLNINHYKFKWDTVIISRYLNYFLYVKHNSNNTILWIHDTVPNYI